jgi:hypothetical protein
VADAQGKQIQIPLAIHGKVCGLLERDRAESSASIATLCCPCDMDAIAGHVSHSIQFLRLVSIPFSFRQEFHAIFNSSEKKKRRRNLGQGKKQDLTPAIGRLQQGTRIRNRSSRQLQ